MEPIEELERTLAYQCARTDIEMLCLGTIAPGGVTQWHLDTTQEDPDDAQALANAIRYLDHRGLLERRIDNPDIAQIKSEQAQ